jgi:hypothetical protein
VLKSLSPREAEIVNAYFGLDGENGTTIEQIGQKYDLTKERIRQIKPMKRHLFFLFLAPFFLGCEKNIDIKLDNVTPKLVVEATIENGEAPMVVLNCVYRPASDALYATHIE